MGRAWPQPGPFPTSRRQGATRVRWPPWCCTGRPGTAELIPARQAQGRAEPCTQDARHEAQGGAVEGMGPHLQQEVGARVLGCACRSTRHSRSRAACSPSWAQVPHAALGSSSGERGTKIKRRVLRGAGSCQPQGRQGLVVTENLIVQVETGKGQRLLPNPTAA